MMTEKMITQRVNLSPAAHALIVVAQKQLGLAHFPVALGYMIEGMFATLTEDRTNEYRAAEYMRIGRDWLEK